MERGEEKMADTGFVDGAAYFHHICFPRAAATATAALDIGERKM